MKLLQRLAGFALILFTGALAFADPLPNWGVNVAGQSTVVVTSASTKVLSANSKRGHLVIQNQAGSGTLTVRLSQANAGYGGFSVIAGGTWEPNPAPQDAIYLNTSTGLSIPVLVLEGLQ